MFPLHVVVVRNGGVSRFSFFGGGWTACISSRFFLSGHANFDRTLRQ